jgi:hypothetical protein
VTARRMLAVFSYSSSSRAIGWMMEIRQVQYNNRTPSLMSPVATVASAAITTVVTENSVGRSKTAHVFVSCDTRQ